MKTIPTLESERLLYVPMNLKFANEVYLSWLNDEEVNKYLEVPKKNELPDLVEYVKRSMDDNVFFWAILKKDDHKHIGNIKIDPINYKHGYGEYGILMGDKTEWRKGYAIEASLAIIDFCFKTLGLRKINLGVVDKNEPAVDLYKKLNFITEGVYKKHWKFGNDYFDVLRMAIFNKNINN